jgi:hypothetical protein
MPIIKVPTSDKKIWDQPIVYSEITLAMSQNESITLDFLSEGPDIGLLGIYNFLNDLSQKLNYSLTKIKILTSNLLETHDLIKIVKKPPVHLLNNAKDYISVVSKNNQLMHFGIFIGRSNAPRLHLASYINSQYANQSVLSYHFNLGADFFRDNIGIESIINSYNTKNICIEAEFLSQCPFKLADNYTVYDKLNNSINYAQHLLSRDKDNFIEVYKNFFVEIVCETYFSGNTFFPTEKTWRPILLKTPFIIQGPVNFLKNLKKLGFKTFNEYWDESYDEDGGYVAVQTIKRNIDALAIKSSEEIADMYKSMQEILEHNYQLLLSLTENDLKKISERTE